MCTKLAFEHKPRNEENIFRLRILDLIFLISKTVCIESEKFTKTLNKIYHSYERGFAG